MVPTFQFTIYYRLLATGYALQSETVFSSRVLTFYKFFLAISVTLRANIGTVHSHFFFVLIKESPYLKASLSENHY